MWTIVIVRRQTDGQTDRQTDRQSFQADHNCWRVRPVWWVG